MRNCVTMLGSSYFGAIPTNVSYTLENHTNFNPELFSDSPQPFEDPKKGSSNSTGSTNWLDTGLSVFDRLLKSGSDTYIKLHPPEKGASSGDATDYTPYIVGGAALLLVGVIVISVAKKKKA